MENTVMNITIGLAGFIVLLNIIATYIVLTTHFEVKNRRLYQILFVWLVPILGAWFSIYFNREDNFKDKRINKVGNHPNISHGEGGGYSNQ